MKHNRAKTKELFELAQTNWQAFISQRIEPNFAMGEFITTRNRSHLNEVRRTIDVEIIDNIIHTAFVMQALRNELNRVYKHSVSLHITSGYRSPIYNSEVGGKPTSFHRTGEAVDIVPVGITLVQLDDVAIPFLERMKCKGEYGTPRKHQFRHIAITRERGSLEVFPY
jgi:uncharacterized protein YcbK (DUF882 family)